MNKRDLKRGNINNKGSALLLTLLILTSILAVAIGAAAIVSQGLVLNRTQKWSTVSYYAAEAGVEKSLWKNSNGKISSSCADNQYLNLTPATATCQATPFLNILGNASYEVWYGSTTTETTFSSTGIYQGTNRRVEATIPR